MNGLVQELAFTIEDAVTLVNFTDRLGQYRHFIRHHGLSLATIAALVRADEEVCSEFFERLASGESWMRAMSTSLLNARVRRSLSDPELFTYRRDRTLSHMSANATDVLLVRLKAEARPVREKFNLILIVTLTRSGTAT